LRPQGAFGVRQLAAAFNKEAKNMDFERFKKRQQAAALRKLRLAKRMLHLIFGTIPGVNSIVEAASILSL